MSLTKAADWHAAKQRGERLPEHVIVAPEPPAANETRTYVAHLGEIWHRAEGSGWNRLYPADPGRLLALYLRDASDPTDWFHTKAAVHARELETAMRTLGIIHERTAA